MKLEQKCVSTTKKEINRRILNDLPSVFDVEKKVFLIMSGIEPDELGEALERIEDSRARDGSTGGTHALAAGVKPRGNGQGRGGGDRETVPVLFAANVTAKAISIIIINSSKLHSPPCNTTSSHRRRISGSHRSINSSSSSSDRQDTLRVGTIACSFPLRPARTLLCRMSNDTSRAAEHVSPSTVHCPAV